MAYSYDQIFAADPANPSNVAQNAAITIFEPGDATMTPLTITDPDGQPLTNPIPVNANGFGSAFAHATLDRVAWAGGGFTGFFTSYEGMKQEAVDARAAAEQAAATAATEATVRLDELIAAGSFEGPAGPLTNLTVGTVEATPGNPLTDDIVASEVLNGTATTAALNATYALKGEPAILASNRIALIGDSITNQNSATTNASTIFYNAAGYFTWANILLQQAFSIVTPAGAAAGEFGGSGKTAAQILAEDAPAWAATDADWGLVLAGTNDIPTRTAAAIAADLLSIWRLGTATGKKVIACTVTPRGVTADTEAMRTTLRDLNRLIRVNAQAEPNVVLCDLYPTVVDPATGKMNAAFGAVGDGANPLHPNGQAAIRMGKIIADTLRPIIPATPGPLPMDAVDAKSLLPNPFMTGDTAGLATSTNAYTLGAGVYTKTKVARTDGIAGEWQQLAITSAPAPNADGAQIQQQTLAVGTEWNVGDTVYGVVEFETDATGWAVRHIRQDITFFGGAEEASGLRSDSGERTAATVSLIAPGRGIIRTPLAVIPANTTRLQMNVHVYGVGTIRFGRFDIIKA